MPVRDSIHGAAGGHATAGFEPYADSAALISPDSIYIPDEVFPGADSAVFTVDAADIFGPGSELVAGAIGGAAEVLPFTAALAFRLAMALCFAAYCFIHYYYSGQLAALMSLFRGKLYAEKLLDEHNYVFETFINTTVALGLLMCGSAALRLCEMWDLAGPTADMPGWLPEAAPALAWIAVGVVAGYQWLALKTAGAVVRRGELASRLISAKRLIFSYATIVLLPVMLCFALSGGGLAQAMSWLFLGGLAISFLTLGHKVYVMFVEEKISIFYWFLYLCAVEIFPVSLIALLIARI